MQATITGHIVTRTPLANTNPDSEGHTNRLKVMTDNGPVDVPIISANTIRAKIRDNIALDILEHLGYQSVDYMTLLFLTSGGTLDPSEKGKKQTKKDNQQNDSDSKTDKKIKLKAIYDAITEFRTRNIIASLLGGATGVEMIPGKLICLPAICVVRETTGDMSMPSVEDVIGTGFSFVRADDTKSSRFFPYLSLSGIEELEMRAANKVASKSRKTTTDENQEEQKTKEKTTAQMIHGPEDYIVPGVMMSHKLIIPEPQDREIGAIMSAFRRLSVCPQLGGLKSKGFGFIEAHYIVKIDNRDKGSFGIREKSSGWEFYATGDVDVFLNAYENYLKSLTVKDITIPEILREA
jgi:hypothetical protein